MIFDIPEDYYSNLSCYEEFVIKTNLLGYDVSDKEVLRWFNNVEDYYWFVANGHIYFLDDKGNKAEDVIIKGDFNCVGNKLTSLEGCLKKVSGSFSCYHNQLTSLKGCPEIVEGSFYCFLMNSHLSKDVPKKLVEISIVLIINLHLLKDVLRQLVEISTVLTINSYLLKDVLRRLMEISVVPITFKNCQIQKIQNIKNLLVDA